MRIALSAATDFRGWRQAARRLIQASVAPEHVTWTVAGEQASLLDAESSPLFPQRPDDAISVQPSQSFTVPREFLKLAAAVALHSDPGRFALLYRLLWRLRHEPRLLALTMDPDVVTANSMEKAIRRDIHKMHAFVRFRKVPLAAPQTDEPAHMVAWFEPSHHIVEAATPFFTRRFPNFPWAILTPERSAHWDLQELTFGPGAHRSEAPAEDAAEELWKKYYASIFNPARLKVEAMRAHMPQKYWRNLPESELIPQLIAEAQERTHDMIAKAPSETRRTVRHSARRTSRPVSESVEYDDKSLRTLRAEAEHCRNCPLWKNATQTVFGKGTDAAKIFFVGEQPGDQEDLKGEPFVGPAGKLLDRALEQAGIDRSATYVTNAVKHFKFEPRGKRRIHKKPNEQEISACHQWYERELKLVQPELIVALGATAARAVFGRATAIEVNRGRIIEPETSGQAADILVTVHPSYLLRVPDEDKDAAFARFVEDLKLAREYA
jgi:DNA polymerase